jgi:hypothetical protein
MCVETLASTVCGWWQIKFNFKTPEKVRQINLLTNDFLGSEDNAQEQALILLHMDNQD